MNAISQTKATENCAKKSAGDCVGAMLIPAGRVLSDDERAAALQTVHSSGIRWIVLGGDSQTLAPLFETGKVQRLGQRELLNGQESINEIARRWAEQWCDVPSSRESFVVAGCNIGASLHRELVYYFLGVLKKAYFLTAHSDGLGIARCIALESGGWREIAPDRLAAAAPVWVGRTCGVRRMVIEEEKKGWRQSLKRKMVWFRDVVEVTMPKEFGGAMILISSDPKVTFPVMEALRRVANPMMMLRPLLGFKPLWELSRKGVRCRVYRDYLDRGIQKDIEREYAHILSCKTPWEESVRQARIFEYRGLDWWEALRHQFEYYFYEYFPTLIGYALLSRALLKRENVQGVLVDEDVCEFNRILVTVAGAMKIPSVVIQHGAPFELQPTGLSPVSASKIAAWGNYTAELLRRWGVPAQKIALVGVPRYDSFGMDNFSEACVEVRAATDWDGKAPLIVYACDPYHREGREDYVGIPSSRQEEEDNLRCFLDGLSQVPDVFGVVKLHPKDTGQTWARKLVRESAVSSRVAILKDFPARMLLEACTLLVTTHSTMAIEAMLLSRPVLTLHLGVAKDLQPHAQLGAALPVRRAEDMAGSILRILHDADLRESLCRGAQQALEYYVQFRDGRSSERVAQLINELISERVGREPCERI